MANSQGSNVFNLFVGGLALTSTIVSLALYSGSHLPGRRIKILDELLEETKVIYEKSKADDLLPEHFCTRFNENYSTLERSGDAVRERTYRATTLVAEYVALFRGLSVDITRISDDVKILRGELVTTSEQNKRRRQTNTSSSCESEVGDGCTASFDECSEADMDKTVEESGIPPVAVQVSSPVEVTVVRSGTCRSAATTLNNEAATVVESVVPSRRWPWAVIWKWRTSNGDIDPGILNV